MVCTGENNAKYNVADTIMFNIEERHKGAGVFGRPGQNMEDLGVLAPLQVPF